MYALLNLWRKLIHLSCSSLGQCEMSSVSSQPQFRYTQTPSKVLHLRNLPWECTEEELIELGKPFGKVVNTKCNVGANKNQAFIEFVSVHHTFLSFLPSLLLIMQWWWFLLFWLSDFLFISLQSETNQAIAMISYYSSSSEPAMVRGKTVYVQYSNRQEIVNNKTTADVAGNVLLVTIEGNDARLVSIDVLHLVRYWESSTWTQSNDILSIIDGCTRWIFSV